MVRHTFQRYLSLSVVIHFAFHLILATHTSYLHVRGLTDPQINFVTGFFCLTMLLVDIPTGGLADLVGRKTLIVSSCLLNAAALALYGVAHTIPQLCLAEILCGLGAASSSGAFKAWLIDELKFHGYAEASFSPLFAKESVCLRVAGCIAALIGSKLANINPSLPWLIAGGIQAACALIAVFVIKEDYLATRQKRRFCHRALYQKLRDGGKNAAHHPPVRYAIAAGMISFIGLASPDRQYQVYFTQRFATIFPSHAQQNMLLGWIWVGILLSGIVGSMAVPWIERRFKIKPTLFGLITIFALSLMVTVGAPAPAVALAAYLFHETWRTTWYVLLENQVTINVPNDDERATISSYESALRNLGSIIGLAAGGILTQYFGVPVSWIALSLFLIGATLMLNASLRQH